MKKSHHTEIIEQVPTDYYQTGVKNNPFQRAWHLRKLEEVLNSIQDKPTKILDVGCASGWFLSRLKKKFPKAKCVGIDVYKDGVKYGKKKYPKITLRVADAHKIPYQENIFDLVICTEVLEHIANPEEALHEIKRVLKKNGTAVIELDSGSLLFSIVWYIWRKSRGKVWSHSHLHSFTVKKLERILKKTGFEILHKKRFNLGMAMVFSVRKP